MNAIPDDVVSRIRELLSRGANAEIKIHVCDGYVQKVSVEEHHRYNRVDSKRPKNENLTESAGESL